MDQKECVAEEPALSRVKERGGESGCSYSSSLEMVGDERIQTRPSLERQHFT